MGTLLQVHPWPQAAAQALAALQSDAACVVISVATFHTEDRTLARDAIRLALRELLAAFWGQHADCIQFSSRTGEALTLLSPACAVGLSVSHAPGCSVAAVHLHGAVGIDVMRVDAYPSGEDGKNPPEWERLARDYMGPATHWQLVHTAPVLRAAVFAQAWSQLEAGMKCFGQGLTEWTPALGKVLDRCSVTALDLPDALRGALALGSNTKPGSAALSKR